VDSLEDIVKSVRKALELSSFEYINTEHAEGANFIFKIHRNQIVSRNLPERVRWIRSMLQYKDSHSFLCILQISLYIKEKKNEYKLYDLQVNV